MKILVMMLSEEYPNMKPGTLVQTQYVMDELAEDTPALLAFMRTRGWGLLADVVEQERAK